MTLAHAAAGAAIGPRIRSRTTAVLACVGAHGLLDLPAHDDLDEAREGVLILATIALDGAPVRHAQPRVLVRLRLLDARSRARRAARQAARASTRRTASRGCTTRCPGPRANARAQVGGALVALALTARAARERARA